MGVYRCQGCRTHFRGPPYRKLGLGAVCSAECLTAATHHTGKAAAHPRRPSPDVSLTTRATVLQRDSYRCRYCGARRDLHVHHINYRSQGVDHSEINLIMLCGEHHALVHTNKRHWQPILRAYIWLAYVDGRRRWLRDLEKEIAHQKTPNM